jgi:hypothetical protein
MYAAVETHGGVTYYMSMYADALKGMNFLKGFPTKGMFFQKTVLTKAIPFTKNVTTRGMVCFFTKAVAIVTVTVIGELVHLAQANLQCCSNPLRFHTTLIA